MPTFFDSTADAAEASEALRGLAHASRGFDQPAEMYGVIGDLSSGMRSLRQVLDQIADVHERKAGHAFKDAGSHEAGVRDALAAAEELRYGVLEDTGAPIPGYDVGHCDPIRHDALDAELSWNGQVGWPALSTARRAALPNLAEQEFYIKLR